MDSLSSGKVASAVQLLEARAAQEGKGNKSTRGDVEGLADTRPRTPPADPAAEQGETKKMAELSIKEEQEVKPSTSPAAEADKVPSAESGAQSASDEQAVLGDAGERSTPVGSGADKGAPLVAVAEQPVEADMGESVGHEPSSDALEKPDAGSVADSRSLLTVVKDAVKGAVKGVEDAVKDTENAIRNTEDAIKDTEDAVRDIWNSAGNASDAGDAVENAEDAVADIGDAVKDTEGVVNDVEGVVDGTEDAPEDMPPL